MDDHDHFHDDHDHVHEDGEQEEERDPFWSLNNIILTTVGIDIGSSTSHLLFARLHLQRLGHQLSSRFVVVGREVLYRSPILLTPYLKGNRIDSDRLNLFVREAYAEAGFSPDAIDSGALILTGEAIKRENARAIADLFADEAGKFVCASAGHNLEAVMAAYGSGTVGLSRRRGETLMNVDVGGGTSKLAVVSNGEILETAAMEVGGRLIAYDPQTQVVTRIESPAVLVADSLGIRLKLGEPIELSDLERIAGALADSLIAAVRREPTSPLARELFVTPPLTHEGPIDGLTFSGGVGEFIYGRERREFGDIAHLLAQAVKARLAAADQALPLLESSERIRATVIGASQFTVQVSGNTISISNAEVLPIRNLPVLFPRLPQVDGCSAEDIGRVIAQSFQRHDLVEGNVPVALALSWREPPYYERLRRLADGIALALPRSIRAKQPIVLVFDGDVGKLVGEILRQELKVPGEVISIDGVTLNEFDYIDIGEVLQPANVVTVVIKSLVFPEVDEAHQGQVLVS